MSPTSNYTRLSIVYQSSLKSGASLALYEICRRYATNPSNKTGIHSIDYWFYALTGHSIGSDKIPEFKYFKRDTLNPAIAEINQLTDIKVSLIIHKNGRKVEKLQFEVHEKKQANLEFPAPPVVDTNLLEVLINFGFSKSAAEDLCATVNSDVLWNSVYKTRARIDNPNLTRVQEPAAYLRWQIAEFTRNPESIPKIGTPKTEKKSSVESPDEASKDDLLSRFYAERSLAALTEYESLSKEVRDGIWDEFKDQPNNRSVKLDKGLGSKMVKHLFATWYAEKLWGEPTEEALTRFSEISGRKPS